MLPGGFSYGDYLRCGAMAAQSPIMRDVKAQARAGAAVLGICNGFQILTEAGLLPGALMRNAGLKFVCRAVRLRSKEPIALHAPYGSGERVRFPVAHGEGNYFADEATLDRLEGEGRVAFRYAETARAIPTARAQHRRHPEREAQCPRPDAASRSACDPRSAAPTAPVLPLAGETLH